MSNNPTIYTAQLAVTPNILYYGLHVFVYEVTMAAQLSNQNYWYYQASAETYFEIVPSGIVVYGLENGNNDLYIGYNQMIELNPIKYSFDLDNLTSMQALKFEFYCRNVSQTSISQNATQFQSNSTNLETVKNLLVSQSPEFCFSTSSKIKIKKFLNFKVFFFHFYV